MKYVLTILILMSTMAWSEEPIKLESQFVGDKEQPAVSYCVSWQGPGSTEKLYRKEEDKYEKRYRRSRRDASFYAYL